VDLSVTISNLVSYRHQTGFEDDPVNYGLRVPIELRHASGGRYSGRLRYAPQLQVQPSETQLNHLLNAEAEYASSPRSIIGASIEYLDVNFLAADAPESPDGTIDEIRGYIRNSVVLYGVYNFNARWALQGSAMYGLSDFEQRTRRDSQVVGGELELSYRRSPRDRFALAAGPSVAFFPAGELRVAGVRVQPEETAKTFSFSARWNHNFSQALSLRLALGPTVTIQDVTLQDGVVLSGDPEIRYFGGATLAYVRARWSARLSYDRRQSTQSGIGTLSELDALSFDLKRTSSTRWSYELGGRGSQRESRFRNRKQATIRVSVDHRMTRRLRLVSAALYQYTKDRLSSPRQQFRLDFGFTYFFRPVRL